MHFSKDFLSLFRDSLCTEYNNIVSALLTQLWLYSLIFIFKKICYFCDFLRMEGFQNLTSLPATLCSSQRLIVVQKSNQHFKFTQTNSDTPAMKHELLFSPALSLLFLVLLLLPTISLTNTQNLIQSMRGPALLSGQAPGDRVRESCQTSHGGTVKNTCTPLLIIY